MEKLKEFKVDASKIRLIGGGRFGEVYQLTDKYVGKFLFPVTKYPDKLLQKEFEIGKIAYDEDISVPKPEGVFNIIYPRNKQISLSFVAEYIEGETLKKIFDKEGYSRFFWDLFALAEKEIKKAKKLDLLVRDAEKLCNIIWNSKKEKVYLTDFGLWKKIILNI